jgi:general stress protein 26
MALTDYEDVRAFTLDDERLHALLEAQNECSFVWSTRDGWPVGVIMSYVWRDGKLWLTSSRRRKRVSAVLRDDRVSVIVSGVGTPLGSGKTATFKGHCRVVDDQRTKEWFYPALAEAIFPGNERRQQSFTRFLDSPGRVIFEVTPVAVISHDIDKLAAAASATLAGERARGSEPPLSTKRSVD